jgi:hypothetical protein
MGQRIVLPKFKVSQSCHVHILQVHWSWVLTYSKFNTDLTEKWRPMTPCSKTKSVTTKKLITSKCRSMLHLIISFRLFYYRLSLGFHLEISSVDDLDVSQVTGLWLLMEFSAQGVGLEDLIVTWRSGDGLSGCTLLHGCYIILIIN